MVEDTTLKPSAKIGFRCVWEKKRFVSLHNQQPPTEEAVQKISRAQAHVSASYLGFQLLKTRPIFLHPPESSHPWDLLAPLEAPPASRLWCAAPAATTAAVRHQQPLAGVTAAAEDWDRSWIRKGPSSLLQNMVKPLIKFIGLIPSGTQ